MHHLSNHIKWAIMPPTVAWQGWHKMFMAAQKAVASSSCDVDMAETAEHPAPKSIFLTDFALITYCFEDIVL